MRAAAFIDPTITDFFVYGNWFTRHIKHCPHGPVTVTNIPLGIDLWMFGPFSHTHLRQGVKHDEAPLIANTSCMPKARREIPLRSGVKKCGVRSYLLSSNGIKVDIETQQHTHAHFLSLAIHAKEIVLATSMHQSNGD